MLRLGLRRGLWLGLNGLNMARVDNTRLQPLARVVQQFRIFKRRVWITADSDQADFCVSEFVWMSSTLWNDQNLFLKIRVSPKKLVFCDERGSDTNCWWEKPLVEALKHSEGIKHTVLFQEQKLTNTKSLIHALSLSL